MVFRPIVGPVLIAVFVVIGLGLCLLGARRARRRGWSRRWTEVRRVLMVVVVALMLAGPSVPGAVPQVTSTTEVWFVVDRTGSMAAEDWNGNQPRLDGVRHDMESILASMAGSRFSVRTWDSTVHTDVPLTSDANAIESFLETFHQENSEFSQGSSPDVPASSLLESLQRAKQTNPDGVRYVFVLTDGETSNGSGTNVLGDSSAWASVSELIDGGLVIGYGTTEGGQMRSYRLGQDASSAPGDEAQSGETGTGDTGTDDGFIHDYSQAGSPRAISRIDEDALRRIADALGVGYLHSPDDVAISSHASSMMSNATMVADARTRLSSLRYCLWPFALVLGVLVAWEAAALAGRVRAMRRAHVI